MWLSSGPAATRALLERPGSVLTATPEMLVRPTPGCGIRCNTHLVQRACSLHLATVKSWPQTRGCWTGLPILSVMGSASSVILHVWTEKWCSWPSVLPRSCLHCTATTGTSALSPTQSISHTVRAIAQPPPPGCQPLFTQTHFLVHIYKKIRCKSSMQSTKQMALPRVGAASQKLEPHMDLAYYESPPGIQLLHCMEFPAEIAGGESTFYDTFVLAELLRERDPEAFATLVRVCATFQKSHAERDHPAQMFYQRPHIVTDTGCAAGTVTAVFWSPPFEGPLCVPPEDVDSYYAAYDAFTNLIRDEAVIAQHMISLRLEPGDTVTFNQRRLLHVRSQKSYCRTA